MSSLLLRWTFRNQRISALLGASKRVMSRLLNNFPKGFYDWVRMPPKCRRDMSNSCMVCVFGLQERERDTPHMCNLHVCLICMWCVIRCLWNEIRICDSYVWFICVRSIIHICDSYVWFICDSYVLFKSVFVESGCLV